MWLFVCNSSTSSYSSIVGRNPPHLVALLAFTSSHFSNSTQLSLSSFDFVSNMRNDGPFPTRSFFEVNMNVFSSTGFTSQSLRARYAAFCPPRILRPSRVKTANGLGVLRYTVAARCWRPTRSLLMRHRDPVLTCDISASVLMELYGIVFFQLTFDFSPKQVNKPNWRVRWNASLYVILFSIHDQEVDRSSKTMQTEPIKCLYLSTSHFDLTAHSWRHIYCSVCYTNHNFWFLRCYPEKNVC